MTREELIQTPEYWRTLYENECERLGIEPVLVISKQINEEELDKQARDAYNHSAFDNDNEWDKAVYCTGYQEGFKAKQL